MITLEDAIRIALEVHGGRLDKEGHPEILHPLYVMSNIEGVKERILAILHDTIEESWDEGIYALLDDEELEDGLRAITRLKEETYLEYIMRLAKNPLAKKVKRVDLDHNFKRSSANPKFKSLTLRYVKAIEILERL